MQDINSSVPRPLPCTSGKRKKGFTLTEILVVVLIISVLSAVVYPLYTKSITKSRAVEAINLLEMVRNKQLQSFARNGSYFSEFSSIGQLTSSKEAETTLSGGTQLKVKDYTLSLNNATKCMSARYQKGSSSFTFSTSYETAGLGCTGSICTSFGDIIGDAKSVCNCGSKTCGGGYTLNEDTCNCDCLMSCDQGGKCYEPYGGSLTRPCASGCGTETSTSSCGGSVWSGQCWGATQGQPTSQKCGFNNSGTQYRTCTETCNGGSCGAWGPCENQDCNPSTKPNLTQACGNCGSQSRTVTCNTATGEWNAPSAWSACSGQGVCAPGSTQACGNGGSQSCNSSCTWNSTCSGQNCPESSKPALSQSCGKCGSQSRTVTCNNANGQWNSPSSWSSCSGEGECSPGATQSCGGGNGTQTCSSSCGWGSCGCKPGYEWNGSTCVKSAVECSAGSKPATSQSCGKCGTQNRTVTCDSSKGEWMPGGWEACSGEGTCSPGATQSCGGGNGKQTCSDSCGWPSTCDCNSGYTWNGSTCVKDCNDCSCAEYKASHKAECCASAPKTDSFCYKDCTVKDYKNHTASHVVKKGFKACIRSGMSCSMQIMDADGIRDRCYGFPQELLERNVAPGVYACRYFSKNQSRRVCRYDGMCDGMGRPGGGSPPAMTSCQEGCLVGVISTTPGNTSEYEISEISYEIYNRQERCKYGW